MGTLKDPAALRRPAPECRERGGAHPPAGRIAKRVGAATPDVRGHLRRSLLPEQSAEPAPAESPGCPACDPLPDPAVLDGLVVAEARRERVQRLDSVSTGLPRAV
jgi:hypothetical protein